MPESSELESLLERLCNGDAEAAERVFREYEPMLRIVVRRMLPAKLRCKFDSSDVVQSVWGDLLYGFRESGWRFATPDHLRAFLIKSTRNRFLRRARKGQKQLVHEIAVGPKTIENMESAVNPNANVHQESEELWQRIMAVCDSKYHRMVELRRQGYSMDQIATQTGYHASSIRRIFYDLIAQTKLLIDPSQEDPLKS